MSHAPVTVGADGVDVNQLMDSIRESVAEKTRSGAYGGALVARAERFNLVNLKKDENFFELYMDSLRESVVVDINDFEIRERRRSAGLILRPVKTILWKILKFYTYRLWSQQNQVNGLLLSATEEIDRKYRDKIRGLEERLARLES